MENIDFGYHHIKHYKIQKSSKKTLITSLVVTLFFALLELFGGIFSNSLSLVSDSLHMFSDVLALMFSLIAINFSAKMENDKFTYGYLRLEIIVAFLNGLFLILISLKIIYDAILRIINPLVIDFNLMFYISLIGLIVNIVLTLILFLSLKKENNLNIKSALWHFLGDLLNSIGVIVASVLIKITNITIIDPIISIIISVILFLGGYKILKKSFLILMEALPNEKITNDIKNAILKIENIKNIHEFHLWNINEDQYILSCHLLLEDYSLNQNDVIKKVDDLLKENFNIHHSTIQVEDLSINKHEN